MNFRKNLKQDNNGFQMAPMVDVMFLLLIFFMVAFIYAQWEHKIGIEVPTASTGKNSKRPPGEIIINITKEGKYFINSIEKTSEQIEKLFKEISRVYKGQPVIIRSDMNVEMKYFVNIVDICRKTGIKNFSISTIPKPKE